MDRKKNKRNRNNELLPEEYKPTMIITRLRELTKKL